MTPWQRRRTMKPWERLRTCPAWLVTLSQLRTINTTVKQWKTILKLLNNNRIERDSHHPWPQWSGLLVVRSTHPGPRLNPTGDGCPSFHLMIGVFGRIFFTCGGVGWFVHEILVYWVWDILWWEMRVCGNAVSCQSVSSLYFHTHVEYNSLLPQVVTGWKFWLLLWITVQSFCKLLRASGKYTTPVLKDYQSAYHVVDHRFKTKLPQITLIICTLLFLLLE